MSIVFPWVGSRTEHSPTEKGASWGSVSYSSDLTTVLSDNPHFVLWLKPVQSEKYEAHCTLCQFFRFDAMGIKATESHTVFAQTHHQTSAVYQCCSIFSTSGPHVTAQSLIPASSTARDLQTPFVSTATLKAEVFWCLHQQRRIRKFPSYVSLWHEITRTLQGSTRMHLFWCFMKAPVKLSKWTYLSIIGKMMSSSKDTRDQKPLSVSMEGPSDNCMFMQQKRRKQYGAFQLIGLGCCGLHTLHNTCKNGFSVWQLETVFEGQQGLLCPHPPNFHFWSVATVDFKKHSTCRAGHGGVANTDHVEKLPNPGEAVNCKQKQLLGTETMLGL